MDRFFHRWSRQARALAGMALCICGAIGAASAQTVTVTLRTEFVAAAGARRGPATQPVAVAWLTPLRWQFLFSASA